MFIFAKENKQMGHAHFVESDLQERNSKNAKKRNRFSECKLLIINCLADFFHDAVFWHITVVILLHNENEKKPKIP